MRLAASIVSIILTFFTSTVMAAELVYEQTLFIGNPAEEVWAALTEKKTVDRYYLAPLGADVTAADKEIYYGTPDNKMIYGKVLKLEKPKIFSHSFIFADKPDEKSTVTYELEPMGGMCALHLRHEGFTSADSGYQDIKGGWPVILSNLKTILETGHTLPWPKQ